MLCCMFGGGSRYNKDADAWGRMCQVNKSFERPRSAPNLVGIEVEELSDCRESTNIINGDPRVHKMLVSSRKY